MKFNSFYIKSFFAAVLAFCMFVPLSAETTVPAKVSVSRQAYRDLRTASLLINSIGKGETLKPEQILALRELKTAAADLLADDKTLNKVGTRLSSKAVRLDRAGQIKLAKEYLRSAESELKRETPDGLTKKALKHIINADKDLI